MRALVARGVESLAWAVALTVAYAARRYDRFTRKRRRVQ